MNPGEMVFDLGPDCSIEISGQRIVLSKQLVTSAEICAAMNEQAPKIGACLVGNGLQIWMGPREYSMSFDGPPVLEKRTVIERGILSVDRYEGDFIDEGEDSHSLLSLLPDEADGPGRWEIVVRFTPEK